MASGDDELTMGRISSGAVRAATGRGWAEWLEELDAAGAGAWDHRQIVAHLERQAPTVTSGWWRQSIAVAYEQARGKRVVGETADAGFQVGVQRSVGAPAAEVWELITGRPDLWLGAGASIEFVEGAHYEVPAGDGHPRVSGEVRVVKPGNRLRITWQPEAWAAPATLQLTLTTAPSGRTAVSAHLEKLPDAAAREAMRARWRAALERIVAAAG
ncbi:MAG TPA: SRPBCC domain-containing protein [Egibacteraceae bacterium]|nr:SRPBCC domain-containing protein [Egibacteraceae bacterium]